MKFLLFAVLVGVVLGGDYDWPQTLTNRQTMVHLFEWKWTDIAKECEDFLQHFGYGAVQVSPPQEHVTKEEPSSGNRPWWIRYQPVSYHLVSRSGTREQFKDMVQRCNNVGVRIVVDAVINHMAGEGQKYGVNGVGDTMNSYFSSYDHQEWFPDVPYSASNFHDSVCDHNINNWNNEWEVRVCRLSGLADLDQSQEYVRGKISEYFNDLFGIGVAGIRVDAAKSIYPSYLSAIYGMSSNLQADIFGNGARSFIVGEVPYGGAVHASEYTDCCGRVTNFGYGQQVANAVRRNNQNFKYFGNFGPSWFSGLDGNDALSFIDNHDTQRTKSPLPLTYKNRGQYTMGVCFMLAWDYGYPRVMSSYYFSYSDQGPPSTGKPNFFTNSPSFNSDQTCNPNSGWVCEHRWPAIRNMALFRSVTSGQPVQNVQTQDHCIAFSRGNKGFFVVNNGYNTWNNKFKTGLPTGTYCDVISGMVGSSCTGMRVTVDGQGYAQISVPSSQMIAIHVGANGPSPSPTPSPTQGPLPAGMKMTVIFLNIATKPGQNIFIRGGTGLDSQFGAPKHCPDNDYNLSDNKCALRIQHKTQVPSTFQTYIDWSQGDNYIDWWGAEPGQGTYNGEEALGTPLAWSTNVPGTSGYQSLNHYGPDYWIVVMSMDCTNTDNAWFEFKGYESNGLGWETDMSQGYCSGSAGGSAPYSSKNHMAKCGYINVFKWGNSGCIIDNYS